MRRRRPRQLSLELPVGWGGARAGSGQKLAGRPSPAHRTRPAHDARHPVHVTLRAVPLLPSFRSPRVFEALRRALVAAQGATFRVISFSVQTDHIHFIVEGDSSASLLKGLRSLTIRTALAINRAAGHSGPVWSHRYHARALTTPSEVRHGLVYVLFNFRKHLRAAPGIDPRSSGPWFEGWTRPIAKAPTPSPVALARTWLASTGWRRAGGPIDVRERPAAPG